MLTQDYLSSILAYCPHSGEFAWKVDRSRRVKAGMCAGSISDEGYRVICIDGRNYKAHRLAWLLVHGAMPIAQIDHVNGNRQDNRILNLREACQRQNSRNQKLRRDSGTGVKGVSKVSGAPGKYQAHIQVDGKRRHLGSFSSSQEAHEAYMAAATEVFGEFARAA
jgi:hypothetical protein